MNAEERALLLRLYGCVDHTLLSANNSVERVRQFASRAVEMTLPEGQRVASVCVYPANVADAREVLKNSNIKVCSVAGGFPHGQSVLAAKVEEVKGAVEAGASEVDIVLPLYSFFGHDYAEVEKELVAMRQAGRGVVMKCILETGEIGSRDGIREAATMAVAAGYDFIKTSTGKTAVGATPEAVEVMLEVLKNSKNLTNRTVGLKVSGGVSSPEMALQYARMAQRVMGDEYINPQTFRIGTSSLTEKLFKLLT